MASIWGFWSLLHFAAEYPAQLVRELGLSGIGRIFGIVLHIFVMVNKHML